MGFRHTFEKMTLDENENALEEIEKKHMHHSFSADSAGTFCDLGQQTN